ncbi:unnamed protein product [Eruca vesicaria subsp. sativa]|uniref:Uncharacterized protein n=1 Tax=Eruca vesicaria subsp. sativa TaxID=29727 RepID=A0ABC8JPE2_ERUVS|nr:unnamed protein product [Eruca vesicaria subsp. sativa]
MYHVKVTSKEVILSIVPIYGLRGPMNFKAVKEEMKPMFSEVEMSRDVVILAIHQQILARLLQDLLHEKACKESSTRPHVPCFLHMPHILACTR